MRQEGFYWVKQIGENLFEIAWWNDVHKCFYLTGHWDGFNESAFDEIDNKQIHRE